MGYSFYLFDKQNPISNETFDLAISQLSEFNREGILNRPPVDIYYYNKYISISGSYGISGKYVEGFILNLMIVLLKLNHIPTILSRDWEYGTDEEWDYFDSL